MAIHGGLIRSKKLAAGAVLTLAASLGGFALTTTTASAAECPTLRWGSRGGCVEKLQWALRNQRCLGARIDVDGRFGRDTYYAVRQFQAFEPGLARDGVVGPQTKSRLWNCSHIAL